LLLLIAGEERRHWAIRAEVAANRDVAFDDIPFGDHRGNRRAFFGLRDGRWTGLPAAQGHQLIAACVAIYSAPFWQMLREGGQLSERAAAETATWVLDAVIAEARRRATQAALITLRRVRLHRRLGMIGGALAILMTVLAGHVAVSRATLPGALPLQFLAIPLATMVMFPALFVMAIHFRHRAQIHKRLILLATCEVIGAAVITGFDLVKVCSTTF
jgi:hypothetical protein